MDTCAAPAGSKPAAPSPWKEAGPETWQVGPFRVHRSLLPQPVYWLSHKGKRPIRLESKEAVIAAIKERAKG